ncbi:GNAT family N-acetyltransferase [Halieaceae bacterium IMCC14734]|uniref:GNAT family N-acetyltransferase n=1 Tax=Candidatus Litorirhabdus singularis TaxID=2518993 RepID=A0ABT3TLV3_9GAMM|nr:GNAT family N-acetyltransferase [Candidatus Litorirhabdus singularis]MCX2983275.1 GNAT family N-acetyltransferase [Candidatus Litorirhabdus singularis]
MSNLVIREACVADSALILHYVRELAVYEKAEHEVEANEASVQESIFGADSQVKALICELDGEPIGFAVYFYNYSTWLAKPGLFLEDLYITLEHRGSGGGKALLRRLASIAVDKNCGRFEWNVLKWNQPSIEFYEALGARPQSEWVGYRMTGAALKALAT